MELIKKIVKNLLPPFILDWLRRRRKKYGFFGNYSNWTNALQSSTGYDAQAILAKVKNARLLVKNGQAAFERDGVVFDKIQYSWPLLAALLYVATKNNNRLNLIDFGGALGTTYFQNLAFLKQLAALNWNVVEQANFVKVGQADFQNVQLKFYLTMADCLKEQSANTLLCLGVLQYLEKPYELLNDIINLKFNYLIFDRTTFVTQLSDRLTVQKMPPRIYEASYPAWFFNLDKFLAFFADKYELLADFDSLNKHNAKGDYLDLGDTIAVEKGFIFKRKGLTAPL